MNRLLPDVLQGFRQLRRNPGVTLTALLALALAIGANSAMFSVVDTVLLRPLPFPEPERLVMVWEDSSKIGFPHNTPAPANWKDWRQQNHVFTSIAATRGVAYSLTGDGPPERVIGRLTTSDFWSILGTRPQLGRTFTEEEDKQGAKVAVLSHGLWQRRYGADPSIVGRKILLNNVAYVVTGVMPPRFSFPRRGNELWLPISLTPKDLARRGAHFLQCVARLREGVSLEQAKSEMGTIAGRLAAQYPETNRDLGIVLVPMTDHMRGESRTGLVLLFGAAGLVLLIACANIANLLLARASSRQREIAVRAALGAHRGVIARQLLTESLLLSGLGALAGLAVAPLCMKVLERFIPREMVAVALHLDLRVVAFTSFAAIVSGLIFGSFLAISLGRTELQESLRQGGRAAAGGVGRRLRDSLVVAQTALALALLTAAGLMVQTLYGLQHVELGMRTDHMLTLNTELSSTDYPNHARQEAFYRAVVERVRRIPGVVNAGYTSVLPLTEIGNSNGYIVDGQPQQSEQSQDALFRVITAEFQQTIGARLREGRFFTPDDRAGTQPVAMVNETFANRHWPGQAVVGRHVQLSDGSNAWLTIVGVVKEIRERGITIETKPAVYMPVTQSEGYWPTPSDLAIRTNVEPMSILGAVRNAIAEVDKDQPIAEVRTMDEVVADVLGQQRQQLILFAGFAALALVLAVTGIYGVISYLVAQRRREIGVRMALGATAADILTMVFRNGGRLIATGVVLGIGLSLAGGSVMASLLYGVRAGDPATLAAAAVALAVTGLAACAVPARSASRVDPAIVLRDE